MGIVEPSAVGIARDRNGVGSLWRSVKGRDLARTVRIRPRNQTGQGFLKTKHHRYPGRYRQQLWEVCWILKIGRRARMVI